MQNYTATGSWVRLSVASSLATVNKSSSNNTLTVNVETVSKTGTWTLASNVLEKTGLSEYMFICESSSLATVENIDDISKNKDIDGTLYYKKLPDINKGKWANYNDDRIVFYENDYTGKDFVAFVSSVCLLIAN